MFTIVIMKTVTVATKLTKKMVEAIDEMIKKGEYTNRSDALRDAARIMLRLQAGMYTGRARHVSKDEIMKSFLKEKGFKS